MFIVSTYFEIEIKRKNRFFNTVKQMQKNCLIISDSFWFILFLRVYLVAQPIAQSGKSALFPAP